jgi:hypothetical protein
MRLTVRDEPGHFDQQTHAYAEFRAFSSIIGSEVPAEHVTVTLSRGPASDGDDGERVVCTIAVTMTSGAVAEARAVANPACAAIDRAVALLRGIQSTAAGESAVA